MKNRLSSKTLFILGFVLLIATNGIVLSGVAFNRSGEPDAVVVLSEREINLPYWTPRENSGMALGIDWQTLGRERDDRYSWYDYQSRYPQWFDEEKLRALGFDPDRYKARQQYKPDIPKKVFVVLELGGEPYRRFLERAEAAFQKMEAEYQAKPDDEDTKNSYTHFKDRITEVRATGSRLFAVDAGTDPSALRAQYSDRTRFIIAPAIVTIDTFYAHEKEEKIVGRIQNLSVEQIHVPLDYKHLFGAILAKKRPDTAQPPAYQVEVAYGKRLEPYIRSVTRGETTE